MRPAPGSFTPNRHVPTLERIFAETIQGFGRRALPRRLNRDKVETLRGEFGWHPSTINKILHGRTVLGEYQPHRRDPNGRLVRADAPFDDVRGYDPVGTKNARREFTSVDFAHDSIGRTSHRQAAGQRQRLAGRRNHRSGFFGFSG
jgi:hypothetical protein